LGDMSGSLKLCVVFPVFENIRIVDYIFLNIW
jgi:hypothetical protein